MLPTQGCHSGGRPDLSLMEACGRPEGCAIDFVEHRSLVTRPLLCPSHTSVDNPSRLGSFLRSLTSCWPSLCLLIVHVVLRYHHILLSGRSYDGLLFSMYIERSAPGAKDPHGRFFGPLTRCARQPVQQNWTLLPRYVVVLVVMVL